MTDWLLAVDVGGTFTDVALLNLVTRKTSTAKVLTRSHDPAEAVLEALADATPTGSVVEGTDILHFLHGTTLTTNALIEGGGCPFALVVTEGLKGIVQVKDQRRRGPICDLVGERPLELVPEDLIFELPGRIAQNGGVVTPIDEAALEEIADGIGRLPVQSVAVSLLFSFANRDHEAHAARVIQERCPGFHLICSSDILARIREWPRTSTVMLTAYLGPLLIDYAQALSDRLGDLGLSSDRLLTMESNGGLMPFTAVLGGGRAAHTLMSGPAAAVQAARSIAQSYGHANVVCVDMGGTSTDISFIKSGEALEVTEGEVCGYQVYVPMLDIETMGAGGGTIASVTASGRFQVGPESARSDPGPACYGFGGTRPTVTDADVVSGYLGGDSVLAGRLALDADAAHRAIHEHIAEPLGISEIAAAQGVLRINAAQTADAIRIFAAKRGLNLGGSMLIAAGGAGPLHAASIAEELGVGSVMVPSMPGAFAAVGLLCCDVLQDFVQTQPTLLTSGANADIEAGFAELESMALTVLEAQSFKPEEVVLEREADTRYCGQGFELRVPVPRDAIRSETSAYISSRFHGLHTEVFGNSAPDKPTEIVSYRVRARVPLAGAHATDFRFGVAPSSSGASAKVERAAYFGDAWTTVSVVGREAIVPGAAIEGPCIIEQSDTTVLIPPGWSGESDHVGTLRLFQSAAAATSSTVLTCSTETEMR